MNIFDLDPRDITQRLHIPSDFSSRTRLELLLLERVIEELVGDQWGADKAAWLAYVAWGHTMGLELESHPQELQDAENDRCEEDKIR